MNTKTKCIEIMNVRYLNYDERHGFACNTKECPCSADYGMIVGSTHDVSDVRCEDCSKRLGWIREIEVRE